MKSYRTILLAITVATLAGAHAEDSEFEVDPITIDPNTIEKGQWEVENVIVGYSENSSAGTKTEAWTFAETVVKHGVSDTVDLQLIWAPLIYERSTAGGVTETAEDSGDLTIALRWNLWGNDGSASAFALIPYAVAPTGSDFGSDDWEGGLILPYTLDLEGPWTLGLQAEFTYADDDIDVVHTVGVGYELNERVGLYAEHIGVIADEYESFAGVGVTYAVTSALEWFLGAEVGLNDNSEDLGLFTGFTVGF